MMFHTGCITTVVTQQARGIRTFESADKKKQSPLKPNPAFYALIPLTVPLDIVTMPAQFVMIIRAVENNN